MEIYLPGCFITLQRDDLERMIDYEQLWGSQTSGIIDWVWQALISPRLRRNLMIFCPHCDLMNSDQDAYCANCGKPLRNQPVEIEPTAPIHPPPGNVERNAIV